MTTQLSHRLTIEPGHTKDGARIVTVSIYYEWDDPPVASIELDAIAASDWGQRLVAEGARALQNQVQELRHGDCATCKNFRMINVPRNGRDWHEHCPDCRELREVPKLGFTP